MEISGEIISADSRQIYKGMTIGTGKDLDEYSVEGVNIPYHLIDIKEPGYLYNIQEFQTDFITAFETIKTRGKMPILCGGSGLYIETALRGGSFLGIPSLPELVEALNLLETDELQQKYEAIDRKLKEQLNALTKDRMVRAICIHNYLKMNPDWKPIEMPELNPLIIGISIDRDLRRKKITDRLSYRLNNGLIEEVQFLVENGLSFEQLDYYGLEYKWVGRYLSGQISKRELFEALQIAIHQFAKKQMTWFRKMEKNGYSIHWIDATNDLEDNMNEVLALLSK